MGYSNWRQDLTEVMTDKEDDKKVTEKNIKNKIVINPKLGEAVEALGGELLEMVEMVKPEQEQTPQEKEKEDPKQKKISQVKKQVLMKKMQAVRQGTGSDIVAHYEPEGEQIDEKKGCVHNHKGEECPVHGKKECPSTEIKVDEKYQGMYQSPASTHNRLMSSDEKARMSPGRRAIAKSDELEKSEPGSKRAKAQKKAASQMARNFQSARATKEELSVDQQMKISQEYNRKSPEEKRAANSKLLGAIKKVKREKDTRTDAQKMTDATGPRPGSRYRGD